MTLNDGTEIVYSSPIQNGNQEQVKVQIETPVENGFKSATCILPGYLWTNNGYSEMEMASLKELVKSTAHLLIRFSHEGESKVPSLFRLFGYVIFFWSNEGAPLEPVHVHVARVFRMPVQQRSGLRKREAVSWPTITRRFLPER